MLEGKDLILATRVFAKENRSKSWMYTLSTLLLLILSIAGACYPFHIAVRLLFSLTTGLLIARLFSIYHDFLHYAVLKDSGIATVIFTFFGYYTLNPPGIWKRSHDYHHKHNSKLKTSSIGSYPIVTKEEFKELSPADRKAYLFIRHPLVIMLGYIFAFWWGMCMLSFVRNPSKHWGSLIGMLVHVLAGVCFVYFGGWDAFLFAFLIPAFIYGGLGSYLFYSQHNFVGVEYRDKSNWSYSEAALHSSSYLKMNSILHWFTGNIGYHHIHHINSRIPFYNLPKVHHAFEEFKVVKTTSFKPADVYRCLQLKVWDFETNTMLKYDQVAAYLAGEKEYIKVQ